MESKAGFFHGSNGGLMVIYHGKSKKSPKKQIQESTNVSGSGNRWDR